MGRQNIRARVLTCVVGFLLALVFSASSWAQDLSVKVETSKGRVLSGLNVYAFTGSGAYTGKNAITDSNGTALFDTNDFESGTYEFRADYLGSRFWSQAVQLPDTSLVDVIIDEETATVTVTTAAGPAQGVRVYLFSGTGSYLSLYEETDIDGAVSFDLPVGEQFKFRADILGNHYWSNSEVIQAGGPNQVMLNAGGGLLQASVEKAAGMPMPGISTYLFNSSGTYLGLSQATDSNGLVGFNVPEGEYKVRADYLGYQFRTSNTTVTGDMTVPLPIPHQDVIVTVKGMYQGAPDSKQGIPVYLFTSSGSYMGQSQTTDANGQVVFNLPEQAYKVRADYLGGQFWSNGFTWQDITVDIPMADAEITVTGAGAPLENVPVYVFTGAGAYLSITDTTDINGNVTFRLPAGSYKFRADYQGSRYWTDIQTLTPDQVNLIEISTGGGTFTLTVLKASDDPLTGINCYVFSEGGSYLGMSAVTDANGQVYFGLADGTYEFRVDYLGYQFWTDLYTVPNTLSDTLPIPHQDVIVTVRACTRERLTRSRALMCICLPLPAPTWAYPG